MTQANNLPRGTFNLSPLGKKMLIGATIGFCILAFFVFSNTRPHPEFGSYWRIRPLLMGPFAGAMGGLVVHLIQPFRTGGWKTVLADVVAAVICIIGMWMGVVLGLSGTMWN